MKVEQAFAVLRKEAAAELEKVQQEGADYFSKGDTHRAREAADRLEKIQVLLDAVQRLEADWQQVFPSPGPPEPQQIQEIFQRTPPGIKTPQEKYRIPILQALVEMDGVGQTGTVLDRVGELMTEILNDFDRERLPQNRDIRWRNTAMWERLDMVKEGLLRERSPRGIWEITESGRAYLKNRMR